jgi:hypothetical protein
LTFLGIFVDAILMIQYLPAQSMATRFALHALRCSIYRSVNK